MAATMLLEIMTPEREFFSGQAEGLIVSLPDGEFCVLPGHTPVVAPLMVGRLRIKQDGVWKDAFTSEGYLEVGLSMVVVFAQVCEWPEEIDERRAREAADAARELLRQRQSIAEHKNTQIQLARAMARLSLTGRSNVND